MHRLLTALDRFRPNRLFGAALGVAGLALFLGLAVHVAHCTLLAEHHLADYHTLQRDSRGVADAVDLNLGRTIAAAVEAASGTGKQLAEPAAFAPPLPQPEAAPVSGSAYRVAFASRNTSLAHRRAVVLLI